MSPLAIVGLLVGGAYLFGRKGSSPVRDDGSGSGIRPSGANVYNWENARGVHPSLHQLLQDWQSEGWFDIIIPKTGGVRTPAMQAAALAAGLTRATNLAETPHGRGAALDVHPFGFNENACFKYQPDMLVKMNEFGEWAERKGFTWGGRWSGSFSPACWAIDHVEGDRPHVEVKNWRSLQYPPPNYWAPY